MSGFTKLKSSILQSTIWEEAHHVRILWITMLALSDSKGVVEGSVPGLARMARITINECIEGLEKFMGPDKWSRTKDHEGRRIKEIDGGWFIYNYEKIRGKTSADRMRDKRERDRNNVTSCDVTGVTGVTKRQTAADPDPDPEEDKNKNKIPPCIPPKGKRATQMPSDWVPNTRHKELAIESGVDLRSEEEHFRDYCRANGKTYKDWDAGFRTWLRNAKQFNRAGPQNGLTKGQREFNAQMDFLKDEMRKCEEGNDR